MKARYAKRLGAFWALMLVAGSAGCGSDDESGGGGGGGAGGNEDPCTLTEEDIPTPAIYTPRWAFEPWISKDISDGADSRQFVEGFKSRNIPVGVLVIDSPWETHYNTFVPNPSRYPEFGQFVDDMHARDVRVVMWVTQMINFSSYDLEEGGDTYEGKSPNFDEAEQCGFLVDDGFTYSWWKGNGAGLDFFNENAVAWWHRQQDPILEMGIDGWKLDFGEEYILNDPISTAEGPIPKQQYSEEYYRDFLAYGVHVRGKEDFVTMVRPYDESYQFDGRFFARPEHAPVGWVGDNRRDWFGFEDALDHIFRSAQAGYVVVGSDIGGYLDRDDQNLAMPIEFSQVTFVRWIAQGAMTPFMQLHGRANLEPWAVPVRPDETVDIYRYWATLHSDMVPFWYSLAQQAYAGDPVPILPIGDEPSWPGDWRYEIRDSFLVAPILDDSGVRDVPLPAGSKWYDWWKPGDAPIDGGTTLADYDATDRSVMPLFVKEGAIIPMTVRNDVTGLGDAGSADHYTILVYPADQTTTNFVLHDDESSTTTIEVTGGASTSITLSRTTKPTLLKVRAESAPGGVSVGGSAAAERASLADLQTNDGGFSYDATSKSLWIKLPASDSEHSVAIN